MPSSLPRRKNFDILIYIFILALALLMAFIAFSAAKYTSQAEFEVWDWVLLPDVIFPLLALIIIGMGCYFLAQNRILSMIDETMNSLISGVVHFDRKGKLTQFNPAALQMIPELMKVEDDEFYIGTYKKFLAFIYGKSLDIRDQSKFSLAPNPAENLSKFLFREVIKLGENKIILMQFYQRASSEIIAVLTDVSLMKIHLDEMAALSDENQIMIRAIEAGNNGLLIADLSDIEPIVSYINPRFFNILKIPEVELIGQNCNDFLEATFGQEAFKSIKEATKMARKENKVENIWLKRKDQKRNIIWYSMQILINLDANGNEFLVCFVSDQTQTRLKEAQIYQSKKLEAISRLAGGVAHDFNNVLSIVDGYTNLIERGITKGADVTAHFEQIKTAVKRGSDLTGKLLTFGQYRVAQKARIDICHQVRDLEPFLASMVDASIRLVLSVQDEPCYIRSAHGSITQIIMNLVTNARDAMIEGGDLVISIAEATKAQLLDFDKVNTQTRYVCIQVLDSGRGIDPDILGRIYEPFFTTKDKSRNPGLGLSLVYGLVKELGGFINAKSTPRIGTSFSVLIPLDLTEDSIDHPVVCLNDYETLERKTILIVENNPDILVLQGEFLKALGLEVLSAAGSEEAIGIQEEYCGKIDFLLCDIGLLGMDGVELSAYFEAKRPSTKIILMSGGSQVQPLPHHRTLTKPFTSEQLADILRQTDKGQK